MIKPVPTLARRSVTYSDAGTPPTLVGGSQDGAVSAAVDGAEQALGGRQTEPFRPPSAVRSGPSVGADTELFGRRRRCGAGPRRALIRLSTARARYGTEAGG